MRGRLPQFLQPFLWSYAIDKMDIDRDKNIIIKNLLDYGTAEATEWLRTTYDKNDIREAIASSIAGDWSKKSLALWQLAYGVRPRDSRFV